MQISSVFDVLFILILSIVFLNNNSMLALALYGMNYPIKEQFSVSVCCGCGFCDSEIYVGPKVLFPTDIKIHFVIQLQAVSF